MSEYKIRIQVVDTSVVSNDSSVHSAISGSDGFDSQAPLLVLVLRSSWTNNSGIGLTLSVPEHFDVHAVDHSADFTLSIVSPVTHFVDIFTAVSFHCLDGLGLTHFIGTIFAIHWFAPSTVEERSPS